MYDLGQPIPEEAISADWTPIIKSLEVRVPMTEPHRTSTAHWLEYADWWNPVLAGPIRLHEGMVHVDDAIGSGIDRNPDAATEFEI